MTIEEMKKCKKEKGYTYAQMSELSGVPLGTIQKIFSGETECPRYETIQALEKLFVYGEYQEELSVIEETSAYKIRTQGSYTIEDYYALPDDRRVELIDGYFYDMAAPTTLHQKIAGDIYFQISAFIRKKGGKCDPMMSPVDVMLDCDDSTMIQPDVIVLCDNDKMRKWGIYGAPDFVMEIVSPSSRRNDYTKKLSKYENAGVREYWILDPYKKILMVFNFENNDYPAIHNLSKPVPVNIYNGELEITFEEVVKDIEAFEKLAE